MYLLCKNSLRFVSFVFLSLSCPDSRRSSWFYGYLEGDGASEEEDEEDEECSEEGEVVVVKMALYTARGRADVDVKRALLFDKRLGPFYVWPYL